MRIRERVLARIADVACGRPRLVIGIFAAVTVCSIAAVVLKGKVSTDLADVLPRDVEEVQRYLEVAEHFAADMLVIAVEGKPADVLAMKPFFERLAPKLEALTYVKPDTTETTKAVKSVNYSVGEDIKRIGTDLVKERAYLFLDAASREALARKLESSSIQRQMIVNRERLEAAGTDYFRQRIKPDPLDLLEVLAGKTAKMGGQFEPKEGESFLICPDGTLMLMAVQATGQVRDLTFDKLFMAAVNAVERETWDELLAADAAAWGALRQRVTVGHTGGYAIAVADNEVLAQDLGSSFVGSLVGVLAVFAIGFSSLVSIVYIGVPLVSSVVWALAVAFLAFGHVSVMSGGFAAILVGLSVDYAIHIYNFFLTRRAQGDDVVASARSSLMLSGSGIFFSALTTAIAFFAIMLTSFVGLSEFGFLAGLGVLFGMVVMMLVLPAMLVARARPGAPVVQTLRVHQFGLPHLARLVAGYPLAMFLITGALSIGSVGYVYATLTRYFFNSDFKSLRADSPVYDLTARVQAKFNTNLAGIFAVSRGATADEALANAHEVRRRALAMGDGQTIAEAAWPRGATIVPRPAITARGTNVRIRCAEIVLPAGALPDLAPSCAIATRPDGSRLAVYCFETEGDLVDWVVEGPHAFDIGLNLEPGSTVRWKHATGTPIEFTFSVWFLGTVSEVTLGAGESVQLTAVAGERSAVRVAWPPHKEDQLRMTLMASPESGMRMVAGRGTISSVDSIAAFLPTLAEQRASAAFIASIDVDRIEADIDEHATAARLQPRAFAEFVDGLKGMVERAKSPAYLTVDEVSKGPFGILLSKYVATDARRTDGRPYMVATYLFPERGELPRPWYQRIMDGLAPAGDFSAPRLVSLKVRDVVYEEFTLITAIVIAGVLASLLWSFRSLLWALAALLPVVSCVAMMLATMLLIGHQLNFVNVLIFPIIVGIGIDYGIHVVQRHLDGAPVEAIVVETGRAFLLTTLTTMVGFGSLITSRYKGLASLGFVSNLGMFYCLAYSLVGLPALVALVDRWKKRPAPTAKTGA